MDILIIDNGTSYLAQLINLLSGNKVKIIKYSEIAFVEADSFDAIILSGGHNFSVNRNEKRLDKEINLIKNSQKPILGICFGFEVIAYTYDAKLSLMQNREHSILKIQVVEPDKIFTNISNFEVFENHRWVVKELSEEFTALASSKDGIEAIKHRIRPIYGVQFHPEMFVKRTCGSEIFRNFLNLVVDIR